MFWKYKMQTGMTIQFVLDNFWINNYEFEKKQLWWFNNLTVFNNLIIKDMDLTKLPLSVVSINDLNYRIHFWLQVIEDEAIVF